jgi:FHS family glucose/mannose:H+ symporter-like MFS transporter
MYGLSGTTAVLIGAIMPEFLAHYHALYALGGRIVFVQAMGFLLGVPLAARNMTRYPLRHVLSLAALLVVIAQLSLCLLPPIALVYPLAVLNGIGASALETVVASVVLDLLVGQRAIYMSRLEVSFGLGALLLPACTGGLIALGLWRVAFLLIAGLALTLAILWQTIDVPEHPVTVSPHRDAVMTEPPKFPSRTTKVAVLITFLFMTFVYVGLEGSVNSFMPTIFSAGLHTAPEFSDLSTSVFWGAMVIGRLGISWAARHLRYDQYLWGSVSLTLASLLILTQIRHALLAYGIVFVLGLGMAAIYSVIMVYANHTFPGMTRTITSLVTAVAGAGGAVFPALVGYAMDRVAPFAVVWILVALAVFLWAGLSAITLGFRYFHTRLPAM